jgi:hypothetical protein
MFSGKGKKAKSAPMVQIRTHYGSSTVGVGFMPTQDSRNITPAQQNNSTLAGREFFVASEGQPQGQPLV